MLLFFILHSIMFVLNSFVVSTLFIWRTAPPAITVGYNNRTTVLLLVVLITTHWYPVHVTHTIGYLLSNGSILHTTRSRQRTEANHLYSASIFGIFASVLSTFSALREYCRICPYFARLLVRTIFRQISDDVSIFPV